MPRSCNRIQRIFKRFLSLTKLPVSRIIAGRWRSLRKFEYVWRGGFEILVPSKYSHRVWLHAYKIFSPIDMQGSSRTRKLKPYLQDTWDGKGGIREAGEGGSGGGGRGGGRCSKIAVCIHEAKGRRCCQRHLVWPLGDQSQMIHA